MFDNRHRYILNSPIGRLILEQDPMGWDETETEIGRSEKTHGIFLTISNNLQFSGEAKRYLDTAYAAYGVNAQVKLTKHIKHPKTDEWILDGAPGYLDFSSRRIKDGFFIVDFSEGGLREILTTNIREGFELSRRTDLKGNPIPALITDTLTNEGRELYLLSKLNSENNTDFWVRSGEVHGGSGSDTRTVFQPFPMSITANSDDADNIVNPTESQPGGTDSVGSNTMFYWIADRDRGKIKLDFKVNLTVGYAFRSRNSDNLHAEVVFRKYTGGDAYNLAEEWLLGEIGAPNAVQGESFSFSNKGILDKIEPKTGESFAVGIKFRGEYGNLINPGYYEFEVVDYNAALTLAEDSFFERTNGKCLPYHKIGERLSEIYSGTPCFESSALTEGKWKELVATCGGWIRNLQKTDKDGKIVEWPMVYSWEDFYQSIHAVDPMAYAIMNEGAKQKIVLENIDYFFQRVVTVDLGELEVEERITATEYLFHSITTGYTEGGKYEKPLGLDEYNTRTSWTTPIDKGSPLEILSPSRADSYGIEDARRKQFKDYPDEDTPYDKENFLVDATFTGRSTRGRGGYYQPRKWQEDFETAPTGVYSPETAYNLRLTPAHNLLRHSKWFNGGLMPMQDDYLRFASSEGNSELTTQLQGEEPLKENADIQISKTKRAMFEPEWIKGKRSFSQEILQKIQGQSRINGRTVNNYYGMFKYRASDTGEIERAFLFTVKVKNEFDFKLLKVYGL